MDAEDANKKIQIIKFDLIVLDVMMPGKSGLEFIKENKKELETPIILLTAKGEPDDRVQGLERGAHGFQPVADFWWEKMLLCHAQAPPARNL